MKATVFFASFLSAIIAAPSSAYLVSDLIEASENGDGWYSNTAPSHIIATPGATPGTNEWFSRYTTDNTVSEFNITESLLQAFKNAPAQDTQGASLIAASDTVKVTYLGTGAARNSWLFLAGTGSPEMDVNAFWAPIYQSGGSNNFDQYNPVNDANRLFETRGGCEYSEAKAGNTCTPNQLGQSREISGLAIGEALIFGLQALTLNHNADNIHYPNVNYFFSGDAANNQDSNGWNDGKIHAKIVDLGNGKILVGFEDIWGGGDFDYNDNIFLFEGITTSINVQLSEPRSLGLLLSLGGLLALVRIRRRAS